MITATVDSKPISATVSGNRIISSMGSSLVVTSAAGGVGPQGPQGTPGTALSSASDVSLTSVADGDLLRYSTGRWRNFPQNQLLDGGNF